MNSNEFEKLGSCKSYAIVIRALLDKYGIPSGAYRGGPKRDEIMRLVEAIVRDECARAAEEAVYRIRRHDVSKLCDTKNVAAYLPATSIRINAGGVGVIKIRGFSSEHAHAAA